MTYDEEYVQELQDEILNLQNEKDDLECELEDCREEIDSLEDSLDDAQNRIDELEANRPIKDITNFIRQCEIRNLWSKDLDDFYNEYLQFFND